MTCRGVQPHGDACPEPEIGQGLETKEVNYSHVEEDLNRASKKGKLEDHLDDGIQNLEICGGLLVDDQGTEGIEKGLERQPEELPER